jgi:predicted PurR-regulated permease PerM
MPNILETPSPWNRYRRYAFPVLWVLLAVGLVLVSDVLSPFIGAVLFAYLLAPLVRRITALRIGRFHIPRWMAVLLIYIVLTLTITVYGVLAVPRLTAEFRNLVRESEDFIVSLTPERIKQLTLDAKHFLDEYDIPIKIVSPAIPIESDEARPGFVINLEDTIRENVTKVADTLRENFLHYLKLGPAFAANAFRKVFMAFLILMVTAFLLVDPDRPLRFLRRILPVQFHSGFDELLKEIDARLAGVVRGQVLICLINGLLTFIGLYFVFGVKFAFMLSTLAAVLSLVPIFGSILSSLPIVAVALTDGLSTGAGTLLWIIGIHLLEANLLNPKIMGETSRIHPALIVLVLLAGEHFYGVVGALFSVPILSVLLACYGMLQHKASQWNDDYYQASK